MNENKWRDSFWALFHILKKDEIFFNELMLLINADYSINKLRKYDGFINSKKEEHDKLRQAIDELVLSLPMGDQ
jgi:hypothetical protein